MWDVRESVDPHRPKVGWLTHDISSKVARLWLVRQCTIAEEDRPGNDIFP